MNKRKGDFFLKKNKIKRFVEGDKIFFYSGLQILKSNILQSYKKKVFSFNEVWDDLIYNELLYGDVMNTNWYHVGDMRGLAIARNLST